MKKNPNENNDMDDLTIDQIKEHLTSKHGFEEDEYKALFGDDEKKIRKFYEDDERVDNVLDQKSLSNTGKTEQDASKLPEETKTRALKKQKGKRRTKMVLSKAVKDAQDNHAAQVIGSVSEEGEEIPEEHVQDFATLMRELSEMPELADED